MSCYGSALAFVALVAVFAWFDTPEPKSELPVSALAVTYLILTSPITGALIGLGTGDLFGHRWIGAAVGFVALPVSILLALNAIYF